MLEPFLAAAASTIKDVVEAAAAAKAGDKVDVGFTWTAAGVWTLVGTAIITLVKIIPPLAERLLDRDDTMRGEKRAEKLTQVQRIEALEQRMARQTTAFGSLLNAVLVSIPALEADDNEDRTRAAEAMRMHLEMAAKTLGKDDPFFDALSRLASTPAYVVTPAAE